MPPLAQHLTHISLNRTLATQGQPCAAIGYHGGLSGAFLPYFLSLSP
jgi:hypothetical protein